MYIEQIKKGGDMKKHLLLLGLIFFLSFACSQPEPIIPPNLKIKYEYRGEFGRHGIADSAKAYSGNELVVEAKAIELVKNSDGGAKSIKVYEKQFFAGSVVYEGYLYFRFTGSITGQSEPEPKRDERISGTKRYVVFLAGWPEGVTRPF